MKAQHWTRKQESWPGDLALPQIQCVTQRGPLNFFDHKIPLYRVEVTTTSLPPLLRFCEI